MSEVNEMTGEQKLGFTGRTRRRWLLFTQYEYLNRCYIRRQCTPFNMDKWPIQTFWRYEKPDELRKNSVGLIDWLISRMEK